MSYGQRVLRAKQFSFTTLQWFSKPDSVRSRFRAMMDKGYCFYVIVP